MFGGPIDLLQTHLYRLAILYDAVLLENGCNGTGDGELCMLLRPHEVVTLIVPAKPLVLRNGGFHHFEVDLCEVGDVNPATRVGALVVVERTASRGADVFDEHGAKDTARSTQSQSFAIDIGRTHDGYFHLVPVLRGRLEENLLSVAVQSMVGKSGDGRQVVDVGPDFGVQGAEIGWG